MNNDTRWLARLGIDQGLFTQPQALKAGAKVGARGDATAFAQELIDSGATTDLDTLEKLLDLALNKAPLGAPAADPFTEEPDAPAAAAAHLPAAAHRKAAAPPPEFPFAEIARHDDTSLAAAFRALLKATAAYGASDLHLSTGARPFIRRHRALAYISDHVLTAEESLRLNTVLLSAGQKKIFLERKDYDYALALSGADRYRVNLMFHKNGAAGAYRMVPAQVKTLAANQA